MTSASMTALARLRGAGLRPTRQRLALAELLLENGDRHITAEQLHGEAIGANVRVSLATVRCLRLSHRADGMRRTVAMRE